MHRMDFCMTTEPKEVKLGSEKYISRLDDYHYTLVINTDIKLHWKVNVKFKKELLDIKCKKMY